MMGALSPRLKSRLWGASAAALLSLVFGLAAAIGPAEADKVGVAAAVNPDAFSSLAGSPQSQLNIGKSIFFNERINTTTSGVVQVLLVDGSTFTVGPGSDLVIDKFVYDPKKGTGQIAASMTKGVMRFVGGKISKNEGGVNVNTPAGALAIRGGIAYVDFKSPKNFSVLFVFGEYLKLQGQTVFQTGYGIFSNNGQLTTRPFTPGDLAGIMAALTNGSGGTGNGDGGKPDPKPTQLVETLSLQDLISDATAQKVDNTIAAEEATEPATDTCAGTECNPPTQVTVRVLSTPGVYTAFPGTPNEYTTDASGKQGILGGGKYPDGTLPPLSDDFEWTFTIDENGRLVGTVLGLTDAHCVDGDCDNIEVTTPPPADVNFPATFVAEQCLNGVCPVIDATITQNNETTTYIGLAVLKKDFFAYQVIGLPEISLNTNNSNDDNGPSIDPLLIFGGKGYDFGTPSGKTYAFELTPDLVQLAQGAFGPFASGQSSPEIDPTKPLPSVSPLLYLETDSNP
ncbi:MAG: FecR domain-containing protein, partial [Methyloceanibacter sp.]|nr:FecR domain-containing protein [Methyloceanibacter sp.]